MTELTELTIEILREQVAKVTRKVGQSVFLPTRIAANAKTLRHIMHWLTERTDFETAKTRLGFPFYVPNVDGVPFARDDSFEDGQLAILNDNVQSADGSLAILFEIQIGEDDDDDLDIAAGDGESAAVPVREGADKGDDVERPAESAASRRRPRKNWVC